MLTTDAYYGHPDYKAMLSKVPEITLFFWIIKVLATTVGETAADFLATNLNLGLTGTTLIMSGMLGIALFFQFRARRYVPGIYWLAVVLISVVGTLITDNLVDNLGVSLRVCTAVFGAAMFATFGIWYASEKTLSIHSITTTKREGLYWLAILFTFALGTAAGDLIAEGLNIGYGNSVLLFIVVIASVYVAHRFLNFNAIAAFWCAYVLTRPCEHQPVTCCRRPRQMVASAWARRSRVASSSLQSWPLWSFSPRPSATSYS